MAVRGDSTILQQNAIPSVASNFAGIEAAIKENHANWAGAQPTPRPVWLLQAPGTEKIERAEFLCGVFGAHGQTASSAVFVIPNLPPGNYAVATFDSERASDVDHDLCIGAKVDELLAEIDKRPFEVQLSQAKGQLARDDP
jgi:hypothetical protein